MCILVALRIMKRVSCKNMCIYICTYYLSIYLSIYNIYLYISYMIYIYILYIYNILQTDRAAGLLAQTRLAELRPNGGARLDSLGLRHVTVIAMTGKRSGNRKACTFFRTISYRLTDSSAGREKKFMPIASTYQGLAACSCLFVLSSVWVCRYGSNAPV